jgi:hypothetical protein
MVLPLLCVVNGIWVLMVDILNILYEGLVWTSVLLFFACILMYRYKVTVNNEWGSTKRK